MAAIASASVIANFRSKNGSHRGHDIRPDAEFGKTSPPKPAPRRAAPAEATPPGGAVAVVGGQ
jgi:hypothetical protein